MANRSRAMAPKRRSKHSERSVRGPASRRGFTVIEMLIVGMITVLIGSGLWTLVNRSYESGYQVMNQNDALARARMAIDTLADRVRSLSALNAAGASDITFTGAGGSTVRYWLNSADQTLRTTVNGAPAGGAQVAMGVQNLTFTYWSYNGSAWTSSHAPASLAAVGSVDMSAVVQVGGFTRQVFSSVKLRAVRFNNAQGY